MPGSAIVCATLLLLAAPASAQHEHPTPAADGQWAWSVDSTVFATGNFQHREFRDFHQFESANWLMAAASRATAGGRLRLHAMFSFEPFTLRDLGSAQVFQTGETFGGAPLIDYQHPHDLVMNLSAAFERPMGRATLLLGGGLVDAPVLGPTAFMHRASANLHPTAPLSHHQLDSSHITPGVVSAGVRAGAWQVDASAFRGREPDEDRLDVDLGALDSFAVRGMWSRNATRAQLSVGRLEEPHVSEPGDVTRITASIEHSGRLLQRITALTVAWGQNRHFAANENAVLGEAVVALWPRGTAYTRAEVADKHILGAGGAHPPGLQHPHVISRVAALTLGYQHELWRGAPMRATHAFAVGADATTYRVPGELREAYGRPTSFHLYGRWTLASGAGAGAVVHH